MNPTLYLPCSTCRRSFPLGYLHRAADDNLYCPDHRTSPNHAGSGTHALPDTIERRVREAVGV